jgi:hypothetical protein
MSVKKVCGKRQKANELTKKIKKGHELGDEFTDKSENET